MLADENLRRSTVALMEEVIAAANKCGYPLPMAAASPPNEANRGNEWAYKPSTLLDFEVGKPLEIEAIWGEPLRQAVAAGAQTPRLETVYSLLKSIDRVRRERKIDNQRP